MNSPIFSEFTNQYELSKTLRFSLIPVLTEEREGRIIANKNYENKTEIRRQDKVEIFFNENKRDIFEVDIERDKQYKKLKYYLTELHRLFIVDSLKKLKNEESDKKINFTNLFDIYKKYEESSSNDEEKKNCIKEINTEKTKLAKLFVKSAKGKNGIFEDTAKDYFDFLERNLFTEVGSKGNEKKEKISGGDQVKKFKTGTNNILLSQNVLRILEEKIKDGSITEKIKKTDDGREVSDENYALKFIDVHGNNLNLMEYFKGWSTYFKNFNEIRGNLYKDDGRKEEDSGTGEKEEKISKANAGQITTRIVDENFEIFVRNAVWAEKNKRDLELESFSENEKFNGKSILESEFYLNCLLQDDINLYNEQVGELNKFFNEKKREKKVQYLKTLHKQLLLIDKTKKQEEVKEFIDDNDFILGLENFQKNSQEKINKGKLLFQNGSLANDLSEIVLNENQTHYICNQFFGSWNYFRKAYYDLNEVKKNNQSFDKQEFKDKEGSTKSSLSLVEIQEILNNIDEKEFKKDVQKGSFAGKSDQEKLVFQKGKTNFEHFMLFLQYYFDSLVEGRTLLAKLETKDLKKLNKITEDLKKAKEEGERIDEVLLGNISEENFRKDISENIDQKRETFEKSVQIFSEFIEKKQSLNEEEDFAFKKAVNEYCNRCSEINRFFALFDVPEGIEGNSIIEIVNSFKENNTIDRLYNEIRNFITKKKSEEEKIKLNFEEKTLLDGWGYKTKDHPKSSDYKCRLFRKDKKIYLGIVGKQKNSVLEQGYEIMDYYQLKGQTIFGSIYKGLFDERGYKEDRSALKNADLLTNIEKIIDEKLLPMFPKAKDFLNRVKENKINGAFNFSITKEDIAPGFMKATGFEYDNYTKIDKKKILLSILQNKFSNIFDFEKESEYLLNRIVEMFGKTPKQKDFTGADKMVYEITKLEPYFYKINFNSLESDEGRKIVALFEIYNKDFSPSKKTGSKKNLHTLYFEELFSDINKEKPIFKLSGGAEVFFREKIEEYKMDIQDIIKTKNPKYSETVYKKRRFTKNTILFHLPIVLNKINKGGSVNKKIHTYIQKNDGVKILGIDRGEKELAYYCLLDGKGKICGEVRSMNEVGSNIIVDSYGNEEKQMVNYQKKLNIKENERMMARKSWTQVEGIRDLKKGYISNVVHDIAKLMVENNALVCLEELNHGFKRGRIKIEKSIYQQFENALVDKLSYLVLEKTPEGVRNALQLTPPNTAQKYWGNQMGSIFYTDAKFTSKTCPNCGFRKRGVSDFDTVESIREKIKNGNLKVFYEQKDDRFRIEYSWNYRFKENNKEKEFNNEDLYGKNIMEIVYSDVQRTFWNSEKYISEESDPNKNLEEIFRDSYESQEGNLAIEKNNFSYLKFIQVFNSILNIRNTIDEKDIISCPKCHFFTNSEKTLKITDGDANGAYNIARKGLMVFEKIRSEKLKKKSKTKDGIQSKDIRISLNEWDKEGYKQWDKKDWKISNNERAL